MIGGMCVEDLVLGDLVREYPSGPVIQVALLAIEDSGYLRVRGFQGGDFLSTVGAEVVHVGHVHPGTNFSTPST